MTLSTSGAKSWENKEGENTKGVHPNPPVTTTLLNQKFTPPSLSFRCLQDPAVLTLLSQLLSPWDYLGQGFKITEKRLRNMGDFYTLSVWSPFCCHISQKLEDFSGTLSTLMAAFGFGADLSPDQ